MFVKMFQSSNNGNVDPINYSDYNRLPFFNDITSNFKHDEDQFPNFSFFHLPNTPLSLSYDQLELQDDFIFHQTDDFSLHHHHQQQQQQQPFTTVVADTKEKPKICNGESNIPRKRSSKRDRHSKITTAQGPRDRRMRLSLKVAREFFDLQDKLCFDKASKTVEWLLIQSRPAIKKLNCTGLGNYSCCTVGASSTSECEVVSGIDEAAVANIKGSKNRKSNNNPTSKKKSKPPSRKSTFHPSAKESREKARARARERTRKKQWNRNQLSSWSPNGEESATQSHTINNNCMEILGAEIEEAPISSHDQRCVTTQAVIDDSLVIKWSPSLNINHMYHTQEVTNHQITDLQSFCKSWEVTSYNS